MNKKLKIALLFGGRSGEHEVSLMSAKSVLNALDRDKYDVVQIGITHDGAWLSGENALEALMNDATAALESVVLPPDPLQKGIYAIRDAQYTLLTDFDVIFPVMHGTYGEDGTMQGLLEMADVAYVGAGVTGAAVGMDKGVFKDVMIANGIPVVDSLLALRTRSTTPSPAWTAHCNSWSATPISSRAHRLSAHCETRSDASRRLSANSPRLHIPTRVHVKMCGFAALSLAH
ncbi:MAG: hypothetical protein L3J16_02105 [Anaerolineales bacterium]|nr:hypothetical protein [Anaerolineales bacterium]